MSIAEYPNEEEVKSLLISAVDKMNFFTKKSGFKVFEIPLGFFFSRVIDNRITRSEKSEKKYESALTRSAAFIIVLQLLLYVIFVKKEDRNKIITNPSLTTEFIQKEIDKLRFKRKFSVLFGISILELLPKDSTQIIKEIIISLAKLELQRLQTDILGKIFHGLIPYDLRKFLAAYYTSNIAGEFLANLVIKDTNSLVLDPACGSGTLLISAYKRFNDLDENLSHKTILQKLYGFDVSTFAAQLAEINLILQNPEIDVHKCQITINDVFKHNTNTESDRKTGSNQLKVDILIGNPPFTRGDRLDSEYKSFLEAHLKNNGINCNYNKKHLGFYAYFLLDSLRFLNEEGLLAFVVPISMINSSSMKPVLSFLLEKYAFQYFVTSDVQDTFSEDCAFKEILFVGRKRTVNEKYKTKFIVLKEKLSRGNIKDFVRIIEKNTNDYEDSRIRIRCIPKGVLLDTINTNWILYFQDQTFYQLFKMIVQSNAVSITNQITKSPRYDVDRGLRAGVSDFFYLPNKYWSIIDNKNQVLSIQNKETSLKLNLPHRNLNSVLRKSALYRKITPENYDYIINFSELSIQEENIAEYVRWGTDTFTKNLGFETLTNKQINKGRKIARVGIVHELSLISSTILAYYCPTPIVMTDNFIFIRTFNEEDDKILAAYLNSSIFLLTYLILRREKTGPLGQIFGTDMRNFFCLNPRKVKKIDRDDLLEIFDKYIEISEYFPSLSKQIQLARKDKSNLRFRLDRKLSEILNINNISEFQDQLYAVLNKEINKFN